MDRVGRRGRLKKTNVAPEFGCRDTDIIPASAYEEQSRPAHAKEFMLVRSIDDEDLRQQLGQQAIHGGGELIPVLLNALHAIRGAL